jgi:hypothetical protein
MQSQIDFSIYQSLVKAFGNVTGNLDISESVKVGDEVWVTQGLENDKSFGCFAGKLRVISIAIIDEINNIAIYGLEDVVTDSLQEAQKLASLIQTSTDLFVDIY